MPMNFVLRFCCAAVLVSGFNLMVDEARADSGWSADYQFDNTLRSRNRDVVSLTEIGSPAQSAFAVENVLGTPRTVRQFEAGNGLRLEPWQNVGFTNEYTMQMLIRLSDFTEAFRKLLDFSDLTSDNGLYFANRQLQFFDASSNPTGPAMVADDQWVQVVLTRSASGTVVAYLDGVQQFSFDDSAGVAVISADTMVFLNDDNGGIEHSDGAIACLRIYRDVLDATAVGTLDCAKELRVGLNGGACQFSTIAAAAQAAANNDLILSKTGFYNERIGQIVNTTLRFEAAPASSNCDALEPFTGQTVVVDGAGHTDFMGVGGILDVVNSSLTFLRHEFRHGSTGHGALVFVREGSTFEAFGSTFSNGVANSDLILPGGPANDEPAGGGCIYAINAELNFLETQFSNCIVQNFDDTTTGLGGALHLRQESTFTATRDVVFLNNSAQFGGAILADDSRVIFQSNNDTANIMNQNTAEFSGGAIALLNGSELSIEDDFQFVENTATTESGGAVFSQDSVIFITPGVHTQVLFEQNSSGLAGGALAVNAGSTATIFDTSFINNTSGTGGAASVILGHLFLHSSEHCKAYHFADPDRYCSRFEGNHANAGSALELDVEGFADVFDTSFVGNTGPSTAYAVAGFLNLDDTWFFNNTGDGVRLEQTAGAVITQSTIGGNGGSGVVALDQTDISVFNSILFNNIIDGAIITTTGAVTTDCNIDQSGVVGPDTDPMLTNSDNGQSHLQEGSPAIGACETRYSPFDLEGFARPMGPDVDMGAFQFDPVFLHGFE